MPSYLPVHTSTIRGDQKISFDIFIKINDKFIHYIRRNEEFEASRLQRIRSKQVKKLFILPEDEPNYLSYLDNNLKRVTEDKAVAIEQRADIIQGVVAASTEDYFVNPADEAKYQSMKAVLGKNFSFLSENKLALNSLLKLENYDFDIYQHSTNVASLAMSLSLHFKKRQPDWLEIISLGAALHDIGKTQLNINPSALIGQLSPDELIEYKAHPQKGVEILSANKNIHPKVLEIVHTHEETNTGDGYPRGLKASEIDPMTQIVSLVNTYDRFITFQRLSPKESWKNITIDFIGKFDLDLINTLKEVLKDQQLL